VEAFKHIDVEDLAAIEDCEIYGFPGELPKAVENKAAQSAERGLVRGSGAQPNKLWSDHVGLAFVTEEITGAFEVRDEAVSRALVKRGYVGNVFEGQTLRGTVQDFEDAENLADDADRCGFQLPLTIHEALPFVRERL
jgi:hypothetical protein